MQAPDPIETALARLMPPALSQNFQMELETMIDDLAGPETQTSHEISHGRWLMRCLMGGGIAAAVGAMFALFPGSESIERRPLAKQPKPATPAFVLMSESDRIESVSDEGWQESADGSAMRALRLKAVEENSVRDEESGMEVQISEPREEVILVPVSEF
jgi:hypothetical protein